VAQVSIDSPSKFSFEFVVLRYPIGRLAQRLFPEIQREINFESETSFTTARNWVKTCKASGSPFLGRFSPSRLIAVNRHGGPRLISSSKLDFNASSKYIALSYVWGANQTYLLTEATLPQMMDGLALEMLPKTIIDAIEVTQRLGFDFIWIDAL
jgi:Heterokaryon incompatibility protein (HET)